VRGANHDSVGAKPRAALDALSNVYHTSFGVPAMMNLWIYYVQYSTGGKLVCMWLVARGGDSQGTPGLFAVNYGWLRVWWASSGDLGDLTSRIGRCP